MSHRKAVNPLPAPPQQEGPITTITVILTKKDVLEGNFASMNCCPLALALRRHFETPMVSSFFEHSLVGDVFYKHSEPYDHTQYLADVKVALKKKTPKATVRYVTIFRARLNREIIP